MDIHTLELVEGFLALASLLAVLVLVYAMIIFAMAMECPERFAKVIKALFHRD